MAQQKNDIIDAIERKLAKLYKDRGTDLWSPLDFKIDILRTQLYSAYKLHIANQGAFNGRETQSTSGLPPANEAGPQATPSNPDDEPR